MKTFHERPYREMAIPNSDPEDIGIPNPEIEDIEDGDEDNPYNADRKAKVMSTGSEWIERKKEQQGKEDYNIFGKPAITALQRLQRNSDYYRSYESMPEETRERLIDEHIASTKKTIAFHFKDLQDTLTTAANNNPPAVYNLYYSFLKQVDNIDQAAALLGFDSHKLKHTSLEELLLELIETKIEAANASDHAQSLKKRQDFIAKKIASMCVEQHASNNGPEWKNTPIFVDLLKFHIKSEEQKERLMLRRIDKFKAKLKNKLHVAIQKGKISVPKTIIDERLEHLQVSVVDGITASLREIWGDYHEFSHSARIASHIPPEAVWSVYVHEALHAISGKIETVAYPSQYPDHPSLSVFDSLKTGLLFTEPHEKSLLPDNHTIRPNFFWLNEAITENLTLIISGVKDTGHYRHERELLKLLIKSSNMPASFLYDAYFENFNGEDLPNHPTPALKKLFEVTNEKLGKRFLIDLDFFIQHNSDYTKRRKDRKSGVQLAIKKWNELGAEFPQFIEEEAQKIRDSLKQKRRTTTINPPSPSIDKNA